MLFELVPKILSKLNSYTVKVCNVQCPIGSATSECGIFQLQFPRVQFAIWIPKFYIGVAEAIEGSTMGLVKSLKRAWRLP